jgi:hypothetical protein
MSSYEVRVGSPGVPLNAGAVPFEPRQEVVLPPLYYFGGVVRPSETSVLPPPGCFLLEEDPFEKRVETPLSSSEKNNKLHELLSERIPIGINSKRGGVGDKRDLGSVSLYGILWYLQNGDEYYRRVVKRECLVGSACNAALVADDPRGKDLSYTDIDMTFDMPVDMAKIGYEQIFSWVENKVLYALAQACHCNFREDPSLIPEELKAFCDLQEYSDALVGLIKRKYLQNLMPLYGDGNCRVLLSYGQGEDKVDLNFVVKTKGDHDILAHSNQIKIGRGHRPVHMIRALPGKLALSREQILERKAVFHKPRDIKFGLWRAFIRMKQGYECSLEDIIKLCEGYYLDECKLTGEVSQGYIECVTKDVYDHMRHCLDVLRDKGDRKRYDKMVTFLDAIEASEEMGEELENKVAAAVRDALVRCFESDLADEANPRFPDHFIRPAALLLGVEKASEAKMFPGDSWVKAYGKVLKPLMRRKDTEATFDVVLRRCKDIHGSKDGFLERVKEIFSSAMVEESKALHGLLWAIYFFCSEASEEGIFFGDAEIQKKLYRSLMISSDNSMCSPDLFEGDMFKVLKSVIKLYEMFHEKCCGDSEFGFVAMAFEAKRRCGGGAFLRGMVKDLSSAALAALVVVNPRGVASLVTRTSDVDAVYGKALKGVVGTEKKKEILLRALECTESKKIPFSVNFFKKAFLAVDDEVTAFNSLCHHFLVYKDEIYGEDFLGCLKAYCDLIRKADSYGEGVDGAIVKVLLEQGLGNVVWVKSVPYSESLAILSLPVVRAVEGFEGALARIVGNLVATKDGDSLLLAGTILLSLDDGMHSRVLPVPAEVYLSVAAGLLERERHEDVDAMLYKIILRAYGKGFFVGMETQFFPLTQEIAKRLLDREMVGEAVDVMRRGFMLKRTSSFYGVVEEQRKIDPLLAGEILLKGSRNEELPKKGGKAACFKNVCKKLVEGDDIKAWRCAAGIVESAHSQGLRKQALELVVLEKMTRVLKDEGIAIKAEALECFTKVCGVADKGVIEGVCERLDRDLEGLAADVTTENIMTALALHQQRIAFYVKREISTAEVSHFPKRVLHDIMVAAPRSGFDAAVVYLRALKDSCLDEGERASIAQEAVKVVMEMPFRGKMCKIFDDMTSQRDTLEALVKVGEELLGLGLPLEFCQQMKSFPFTLVRDYTRRCAEKKRHGYIENSFLLWEILYNEMKHGEELAFPCKARVIANMLLFVSSKEGFLGEEDLSGKSHMLFDLLMEKNIEVRRPELRRCVKAFLHNACASLSSREECEALMIFDVPEEVRDREINQCFIDIAERHDFFVAQQRYKEVVEVEERDYHEVVTAFDALWNGVGVTEKDTLSLVTEWNMVMCKMATVVPLEQEDVNDIERLHRSAQAFVEKYPEYEKTVKDTGFEVIGILRCRGGDAAVRLFIVAIEDPELSLA